MDKKQEGHPVPEFPGFNWPTDVKDLIDNESVGTWMDTSWHNDGMPQLTNETLRVVLWVNFPVEERDKETADWSYSLQPIMPIETQDGPDWVYSDDVLSVSEDWNEVDEFLNQRRSEVEHA